MSVNVWLVEDARDIREEAIWALSSSGLLVSCFSHGAEALEALGASGAQAAFMPDLLLVDDVLPDMMVEEFCRTAQKNTRTKLPPIVVIAADAERAAELLSRNITIEDCIVKPFAPATLVARLNGVLHRLHPATISGRFLMQGKGEPNLVCSPDSRQIRVDGVAVQLAPIEHRLLVTLLAKKGMALSRAELLAAIWSGDTEVSPRSVDVTMFSLRKKLGRIGASIKTVRGSGYKFIQ
jgi:Response regulators consisting of a CheY-like receiver domain and a winged-helix DNA-binding domain